MPADALKPLIERERARTQTGEEPARPPLRELLVELRQEHPGQVADDFGLQEEILHKALDRALARAVGVAHPRRHLALQIEREPVLGAPRDRVEMTAHRPEKRLGAAERAVLGRGEQADIHQFARLAHLVDVLADPVERVEVAQPPLALLDVGFDDVAAVAQPFVALLALGELLGHELPLGALDDLGPEARLDLAVERLVAPDIAPLEHRGADRQVLAAHPHHLVERPA